jgi:hypothetical protein
MSRRFACLLALFTLAFAACGGDDDDKNPANPGGTLAELSVTVTTDFVMQNEFDSSYSDLRWKVNIVDEDGNLALASIEEAYFAVVDAEGHLLIHPVSGELEEANASGQGSGYIIGDLAVYVSGGQAQLAAPEAARAVAEHCASAVLYAWVKLSDGREAESALAVEPINPAICEAAR